MKITVTTLTADKCFLLDVSEDLELHNLKAYCEVESGIAKNVMLVYHNGNPLLNDSVVLRAYGIHDGDCLTIAACAEALPQSAMQTASAAAAASGSNVREYNMPMNDLEPDMMRQILLSNPDALALLRQNNVPLAQALDSGNVEQFARVLREQRGVEQQYTQTPQTSRSQAGGQFNVDVQRNIAEQIRRQNIQANMETAMEYNPEAFGGVTLLFVNCKLNGIDLRCLIDTGAETTVISATCAERCQVSHLIDTRWVGHAVGVGKQRIFGRIHIVQLQIENDFLMTALTVLDQPALDVVLGLDVLKRHQCQIDLKRNILRIGTSGTETTFLHEHEIPRGLQTQLERNN